MSDGVIAYVATPEKRVVVVTDRVWAHVVTQHENMAPYLDDVLRTIRAPDYREPDQKIGRERFYGRRLGPYAWLRVVIESGKLFDEVVTAFGQVNDPRCQ